MSHRVRTDESGFTLIELLVVVVIIGILAAIALPMFLGQQTKAHDADAKAAARNALVQVESCFAEEHDYGLCDAAADDGMADAGIDWTQVTVAATGIGSAQVEVSALSASGTRFSIAKGSGGAITHSCTNAGSGGCNAAGSW